MIPIPLLLSFFLLPAAFSQETEADDASTTGEPELAEEVEATEGPEQGEEPAAAEEPEAVEQPESTEGSSVEPEAAEPTESTEGSSVEPEAAEPTESTEEPETAAPAETDDETPATEGAEQAAQGAQEAPVGTGGVPLVIDPTAAQEVPDLTAEQADWLKPKLALLPPNTRAQTDFTAYVLEWGEIKLGLNTVQLGLLPGLQGGTSVPLLALRVPNANLKLDFVRAGPLDLAATGHWYSMPREGFSGSFLSAGGMMSLKILEAWSLHGGASYAWIDTSGFPDLDKVSRFITGDEVIDTPAELESAVLEARLLQAKVATDIRFNRRDSIVLQFATIPWVTVDTEPVPEDIPPIFGLDQLLALNGQVPVSQSYTASIAWQIQWKHAQLRLGIGHSSTPGAWLTQCMDFSYRFLGSTRISEYRQRRTWRKNQKAAEEGTLDQEEQTP